MIARLPCTIRIAFAPIATILLSMSSGIRAADPPHQHHGEGPSVARQQVEFPPELKEHTLENMRDHLLTLERIQDSLSRGAFDAAAELAETRLGLSSLGLHEAHEVAKYMPQGMQDIGMEMHRAASRFALDAANAGATGNLNVALGSLANVTSKCVACHSTYRLK